VREEGREEEGRSDGDHAHKRARECVLCERKNKKEGGVEEKPLGEGKNARARARSTNSASGCVCSYMYTYMYMYACIYICYLVMYEYV